MITLRRSQERGTTKLAWLDSRHTFSFNNYYDPQHVGFSDLRVINEDRVEPSSGFPRHSHRNMEIITYVLAGALAHKDSTGASLEIQAGEVQRMSAGTGISHSEYNPSATEPVHFLQIWIEPGQDGLPPSYEQRTFPATERGDTLRLVASPDGQDGAVTVHQDVRLYLGTLEAGAHLTYPLRDGRRAWIQVTRGEMQVNDMPLTAGDGAAVSQEAVIQIHADAAAELLLFDLS